MKFDDPKSFLLSSLKSSQAAYENFKKLLFEIENASHGSLDKKNKIAFLHSITQLNRNHNLSGRSSENQKYFDVITLDLRHGSGSNTQLELLLLPSTFAPEEWSFTFYEGLSRMKPDEFQDRTLAELGCGIGWISIALAQQKNIKKIYGLDINPKAILCSKLNLYLNGYDSTGEPNWKSGTSTLDQVVEFHTSDLLDYCYKKSIQLDRVIGCIPQVLDPNPELSSKFFENSVSEQESDEFLYALSNYTPNQGYIEDEFGLGLIARALEESVEVLRPSGKLILNLGGRPGKKVLEHLFNRRGFRIKPIWSTHVEQAKDTDISSLIEIEDRTSHRFEFFIKDYPLAPISAKAAQSYVQSGGAIAHALTVYEAKLRDPTHTRQIIRHLRDPQLSSARATLDLSYENDSLAEEKMSFLASLGTRLLEKSYFEYGETQGYLPLRQRFSDFFSRYHRFHFSSEQILITPSLQSCVENVIALFRPQRLLIDSEIAHSLRSQPSHPNWIETPSHLEVVRQLLIQLKPQMAILSLQENESATPDAFMNLIELCEKTNTRLWVDISHLIDLSSTPRSFGALRYLSQNRLAPHVSLMGGLVKNRLYKDLQVGFLMSHHPPLLGDLVRTAELTYSRTPQLTQLFYERILHDLLSFHVIDSKREKNLTALPSSETPRELNPSWIAICDAAQRAFQHASIRGEEWVRSLTRRPLRLDYGENTLPSGKAIQGPLFEAFSKMKLTQEECDPTFEIKQWLRQFTGIQADPPGGHAPAEVFLAGGVAPLYARLAQWAAQRGDTLVLPQGSYGYFSAAAQFFGCEVKWVPTHAEDQFKVRWEELIPILKTVSSHAWIHLSAPVVNPTGAIYTLPELELLQKKAKEFSTTWVYDTIFSGLEHTRPEKHITGNLSHSAWVALGGLSKLFSAGGLRVGWAVVSDPFLLQSFKKHPPESVHSSLAYALKHIYSQTLSQESVSSSTVQRLLSEQSELLRRRSEQLEKCLKSCGWEILAPQGGLFLVASPTGWVGKTFQGQTLQFQNLATLLAQETGVTLNSPEWTGIPGYFRFVLSVEEEVFQSALSELGRFNRLLTQR